MDYKKVYIVTLGCSKNDIDSYVELKFNEKTFSEELQDFVKDIKQHRFWDREVNPVVPA